MIVRVTCDTFVLLHAGQKFASKEREKIKKHWFYGKHHGKAVLGLRKLRNRYSNNCILVLVTKMNWSQGFYVYLHVYQVSDLLPKSSVQPEVFPYYDSNALDKLKQQDKIDKMKGLEK